MVILLGLLIFIGFLIIVTIVIYNSLIRLRNQVDEAWSDIDVQLKRRYTLIPNLIESVKGYKDYESNTLQKVTELRQQAMNAQSMQEKSKAESALSLGLGKFLAVAENYPDLKANTNFIDLQQNLSELENHIQNARRYYNGTTRDYNIKIETVPSNIIAIFFNFNKRDFFALDSDAEREAPKVSF